MKKHEYPWTLIPEIKEIILTIGKSLNKNDYEIISPDIWIHKTADVASSALLKAPCIIGAEAEIRHCAFIRGSALIGNNCVVGNSCEIKNAILFDSVQVPHFNYIGDSILGYKSHTGAGVITSNVKSDRSEVTVRNNGEIIQTGLKKLGAMIGDFAEIGCNTVLNPGTVIGRNSTVYPLSNVRGFISHNSIYKSEKSVVIKDNTRC